MVARKRRRESTLPSSLGARVGHVGDGQKQANMLDVAVVKRPRIDDQLACLLVWPPEVDFCANTLVRLKRARSYLADALLADADRELSRDSERTQHLELVGTLVLFGQPLGTAMAMTALERAISYGGSTVAGGLVFFGEDMTFVARYDDAVPTLPGVYLPGFFITATGASTPTAIAISDTSTVPP